MVISGQELGTGNIIREEVVRKNVIEKSEKLILTPLCKH